MLPQKIFFFFFFIPTGKKKNCDISQILQTIIFKAPSSLGKAKDLQMIFD